MRHVIPKVGIAAAAAAAVSVPVAAAKSGTERAEGSSAKVFIAANACTGHAFKPRKVTFACADGNAYATNLRYSSYGASRPWPSGRST